MKKYEEQLLQRIRQYDKRAEQELISHFGPRIARKVMYAIGSRNDDWKDVANESMLAVLESLRNGQFEPQRGTSLGSYIYGITQNKIRDYCKDRKKQVQHLPMEPVEDLGIDVEYEIEKRELQFLIHGVLKKLKYKYRQVLYLRYFDDLSVGEISQRIDLPPRRVSERLNYAIKLLQKEMKKKKYFSIFGEILLTLI